MFSRRTCEHVVVVLLCWRLWVLMQCVGGWWWSLGCVLAKTKTLQHFHTCRRLHAPSCTYTSAPWLHLYHRYHLYHPPLCSSLVQTDLGHLFIPPSFWVMTRRWGAPQLVGGLGADFKVTLLLWTTTTKDRKKEKKSLRAKKVVMSWLVKLPHMTVWGPEHDLSLSEQTKRK